MLNTVVSVGFTRVFNGIGLGAGRPVRLAIVVLVGLERLMRLASVSVPVFTDHRSTPQAASAGCDAEPSNVRGRTRASAKLSPTPCRLQRVNRDETRILTRLRLPIVHLAMLN